MISQLLGWYLRPGDPAAVIDMKTGQVGWMPINGHEKVQVGHYYLLKHDYAQAWKWYQEAERELPEPAPIVVNQFDAYLRLLQGPRDFSFFEYHCLNKLGRQREAVAKLQQFQENFLPKLMPSTDGQFGPSLLPFGIAFDGYLKNLLDAKGLLANFLRDIYAAEVFLSVNAAQDGEAFFRAALDKADNPKARLSPAIALSQILLLQGKYPEYATLATDTIAPLLNSVLTPLLDDHQQPLADADPIPLLILALDLMPLGSEKFLAQLPKSQLQTMRLRWEKLQSTAEPGSRRIIDIVLRGLYQSLKMGKEFQATEARLANHSNQITHPQNGEDITSAIRRMNLEIQDLMRQR